MKKALVWAALAFYVIYTMNRAFRMAVMGLVAANKVSQEVEYAKNMRWASDTFSSVFSTAAKNEHMTEGQHDMLMEMVNQYEMEWGARPSPPSERGV